MEYGQKSTRVLLFATNYLPAFGGAELALKHISDRIPECQFDLITSRPHQSLPAQERMGNINVFRVGSGLSLRKFILPKLFFPVSAFLKARSLWRSRGPYQIIFALQASSAAGGAWLFKFFHPRLSFTLNIQEGKELHRQGRLINFFRRMIIKKADKVIVISTFLKQYVLSLGIASHKIAIIPNGVDIEKFKAQNVKRPTPPKQPFRLRRPSKAIAQNSKRESQATQAPDKMKGLKEKLNINSNERVIISVSRLVPKNGMDDLIRAFALFAHSRESLAMSYKLVLIGDGPQRQQLEVLATERGVAERIHFVGNLPHNELPNYLAIADAFVRPSRSEGLGTAFLEAMAAGVPVVATPVGGISDFLQNNETGLLAQAGNAQSIVQSMQTILHDRELREKIIKKARALVTQRYSWDKIAQQYREIFRV